MTKKDYMKPATQVVRLQHQHIICASNHGVSDTLHSEKTVDSAWSRGSNGFDDDE